jgi:hypothetical protein
MEERIDIMKKLNIKGIEYTLEYSFMAAEHKETVQKMFNIVSGAYILKQAQKADKEDIANAMFDGTSEMVADIPNIVKTCFYSGLLENHKLKEDESYELIYTDGQPCTFSGLTIYFEDGRDDIWLQDIPVEILETLCKELDWVTKVDLAQFEDL